MPVQSSVDRANAALGPTRDIVLPQGTVRVHERGAGPAIVLVHGAFVDAKLWAPVVPALSEAHLVVAPNLPLGSHPIAMNEDADVTPLGVARLVADLLEELDLRDVTLVGNDTGGAIAQMVVTKHPERVGRLVLTNADSFEHFPPRQFKNMARAGSVPGGVTALLAAMRPRKARSLPNMFGRLSHAPLDGPISDVWVLTAARDAGVRRDLGKLLRGIDSRDTIAAGMALRELEMPALLAWGADDPFFTFDQAQRLADTIPDVRLERIERCRTFVPLDQPDVLARLIAEFVAETAAERAAIAS